MLRGGLEQRAPNVEQYIPATRYRLEILNIKNTNKMQYMINEHHLAIMRES